MSKHKGVAGASLGASMQARHRKIFEKLGWKFGRDAKGVFAKKRGCLVRGRCSRSLMNRVSAKEATGKW